MSAALPPFPPRLPQSVVDEFVREYDELRSKTAALMLEYDTEEDPRKKSAVWRKYENARADLEIKWQPEYGHSDGRCASVAVRICRYGVYGWAQIDLRRKP